MNILVTGSNGFIGKNLIAWLSRKPGIPVLEFDQDNTALADLTRASRWLQADLVFHLAGVNRPQIGRGVQTGNVDLTAQMCDLLRQAGRATPIVLSSSIQAELDNPYGVSKRQAEEVLARLRRAQRSAGADLPAEQRLWQVVPAQLQLGGGHLLPQHRPRPADHHLRSQPGSWNWSMWTMWWRAFWRRSSPAKAAPGVAYREVTPSYTVTLGASWPS